MKRWHKKYAKSVKVDRRLRESLSKSVILDWLEILIVVQRVPNARAYIQ